MSNDASDSSSSSGLSRRSFVGRTLIAAAVVAVPSAVTASPARPVTSIAAQKGDEPGESRHPDRSPLPASQSQPAIQLSQPPASMSRSSLPVIVPSASPRTATPVVPGPRQRAGQTQQDQTIERKKRPYDFF